MKNALKDAKKAMATQFDKFADRNNFKFNLTDGAEFIGRYGFPKLRKSDYIPKKLVPFNFAKTQKNPEKLCIHFFVDDFQFERVWNYPGKYMNLFKRFEGAITPDFSMLDIMSKAQRIYNCYRNRVLAYWMQNNGIKIVPTVEWALYNELDWCLDGVPKNSSIAIGTYGSMKSLYNRYSLLKGMERIEKELHPTTVICYGSEIKSAHSIFKKIIFFENYCNTIKKRVK